MKIFVLLFPLFLLGMAQDAKILFPYEGAVLKNSSLPLCTRNDASNQCPISSRDKLFRECCASDPEIVAMPGCLDTCAYTEGGASFQNFIGDVLSRCGPKLLSKVFACSTDDPEKSLACCQGHLRLAEETNLRQPMQARFYYADGTQADKHCFALCAGGYEGFEEDYKALFPDMKSQPCYDLKTDIKSCLREFKYCEKDNPPVECKCEDGAKDCTLEHSGWKPNSWMSSGSGQTYPLPLAGQVEPAVLPPVAGYPSLEVEPAMIKPPEYAQTAQLYPANPAIDPGMYPPQIEPTMYPPEVDPVFNPNYPPIATAIDPGMYPPQIDPVPPVGSYPPVGAMPPIYPPEIDPGPPAPWYPPPAPEIDCPANEEVWHCGTICEPTCDNHYPMCIEMCAPPACGCIKGHLRHEGQCMPAEKCRNQPPLFGNECPAHETLLPCGPACEPTCDNLSPVCTMQCLVPSCGCKPGYVRIDGVCVEQSACHGSGSQCEEYDAKWSMALPLGTCMENPVDPGMCYCMSSPNAEYGYGKAKCEGMGGSLATAHTDDIRMFLLKFMNRQGVQRAWVGLEEQGTWKWTSPNGDFDAEPVPWVSTEEDHWEYGYLDLDRFGLRGTMEREGEAYICEYSFGGNQPPASTTCPHDEEIWQCGNLCEPTCDNHYPMCAEVCAAPACGCIKGYVRFEGQCIPAEKCHSATTHGSCADLKEVWQKTFDSGMCAEHPTGSGMCYCMNNPDTTYGHSKAECEKMGGALATAETEDIRTFLVMYMTRMDVSKAWVALEELGSWTWTSPDGNFNAEPVPWITDEEKDNWIFGYLHANREGLKGSSDREREAYFCQYKLGNGLPPVTVCPAHEEVWECGNACEPTCDNQNLACKMMCGSPACGCMEGHVRHEGHCIPMEKCPSQPPMPGNECPAHETLLPCGQICEPTCTDLNPVCAAKCIAPSCGCKPGYVRIDGVCVDQVICRENYMTTLQPSWCPIDEEIWNCGTHCEPTCDNLNPVCIEICAPPACGCRKGYARHNGQCIPMEKCPNHYVTTYPPEPEQCPANEILLPCGQLCEPTCMNPMPFCTMQCLVSSCGCKHGYARVGGVCVEASKCFGSVEPTNNPNACPANEVMRNTYCEPVCGSNKPVCDAALSGPRCTCRNGFVRQNGACIRRKDCIPTCGANEEIKECGNACEPRCFDPGLSCSSICHPPACGCIDGLVRHHGMCVKKEECPAVQPMPWPNPKPNPNPKPPKPPGQCAGNETLLTCGTMCEPTCWDRAPICTAMCLKPSCGCLAGYARINGRCMHQNECPAPIPAPGSCPMNEEMQTCGTLCEPTCEDQYPACAAMCLVPACGCMRGFARIDGKCVPYHQCFAEPQPPIPVDSCASNPCPYGQKCVPGAWYASYECIQDNVCGLSGSVAVADRDCSQCSDSEHFCLTQSHGDVCCQKGQWSSLVSVQISASQNVEAKQGMMLSQFVKMIFIKNMGLSIQEVDMSVPQFALVSIEPTMDFSGKHLASDPEAALIAACHPPTRHSCILKGGLVDLTHGIEEHTEIIIDPSTISLDCEDGQTLPTGSVTLVVNADPFNLLSDNCSVASFNFHIEHSGEEQHEKDDCDTVVDAESLGFKGFIVQNRHLLRYNPVSKHGDPRFEVVHDLESEVTYAQLKLLQKIYKRKIAANSGQCPISEMSVAYDDTEEITDPNTLADEFLAAIGGGHEERKNFSRLMEIAKTCLDNSNYFSAIYGMCCSRQKTLNYFFSKFFQMHAEIDKKSMEEVAARLAILPHPDAVGSARFFSHPGKEEEEKNPAPVITLEKEDVPDPTSDEACISTLMKDFFIKYKQDRSFVVPNSMKHLFHPAIHHPEIVYRRKRSSMPASLIGAPAPHHIDPSMFNHHSLVDPLPPHLMTPHYPLPYEPYESPSNHHSLVDPLPPHLMSPHYPLPYEPYESPSMSHPLPPHMLHMPFTHIDPLHYPAPMPPPFHEHDVFHHEYLLHQCDAQALKELANGNQQYSCPDQLPMMFWKEHHGAIYQGYKTTQGYKWLKRAVCGCQSCHRGHMPEEEEHTWMHDQEWSHEHGLPPPEPLPPVWDQEEWEQDEGAGDWSSDPWDDEWEHEWQGSGMGDEWYNDNWNNHHEWQNEHEHHGSGWGSSWEDEDHWEWNDEDDGSGWGHEDHGSGWAHDGSGWGNEDHGSGWDNGEGHGSGWEHGSGSDNGEAHGSGWDHGDGWEHGSGWGNEDHGSGWENGEGHGSGWDHGDGWEHGSGWDHGGGWEHGDGWDHGSGWEHGDEWEHGDGWDHGSGWEHGDEWEHGDGWDNGSGWDHGDEWEHGDGWDHGSGWDHGGGWEHGDGWDHGSGWDHGDGWDHGSGWDHGDEWEHGDGWDHGSGWDHGDEWEHGGGTDHGSGWGYDSEWESSWEDSDSWWNNLADEDQDSGWGNWGIDGDSGWENSWEDSDHWWNGWENEDYDSPGWGMWGNLWGDEEYDTEWDSSWEDSDSWWNNFGDEDQDSGWGNWEIDGENHNDDSGWENSWGDSDQWWNGWENEDYDSAGWGMWGNLWGDEEYDTEWDSSWEESDSWWNNWEDQDLDSGWGNWGMEWDSENGGFFDDGLQWDTSGYQSGTGAGYSSGSEWDSGSGWDTSGSTHYSGSSYGYPGYPSGSGWESSWNTDPSSGSGSAYYSGSSSGSYPSGSGWESSWNTDPSGGSGGAYYSGSSSGSYPSGSGWESSWNTDPSSGSGSTYYSGSSSGSYPSGSGWESSWNTDPSGGSGWDSSGSTYYSGSSSGSGYPAGSSGWGDGTGSSYYSGSSSGSAYPSGYAGWSQGSSGYSSGSGYGTSGDTSSNAYYSGSGSSYGSAYPSGSGPIW